MEQMNEKTRTDDKFSSLVLRMMLIFTYIIFFQIDLKGGRISYMTDVRRQFIPQFGGMVCDKFSGSL